MRYEMLTHMPELLRALGRIRHGQRQPGDPESHMHYRMLQANGLATSAGEGYVLTEHGERMILRRERERETARSH
ncbi:hypothetical protein N8I74_07345 [Chitiniphilus purpureus]|uniref:Preprotein translocase subunit SecA n=1 Tax=Chitiniphilus purpureus TaxID=2981137 RepID=A0ABY6DR24_9NEIS|nr:hypothetical protein [Chitiniphilus sp. CD1]UXY16824.1 hypothetical protein N8I74_07345 [Chitiniphilus sp. CD1]